MKSYFEWLMEASLAEASLEQATDVLRKAEWSKEQTNKLYPTLFNNKNFKTDARKYRIYLPFSFNKEIKNDNQLFWDGSVPFEDFATAIKNMFGKDVDTMRYIYQAFESYIDTDKYNTYKFDYMNGYVFDKRDRPVKIGKVFQNLIKEQPQLKDEIESLLGKFNDDRLRDGSSKTDFNNLMIVVTKNPIDILNQSTDRRWTSCMNLESGVNKQFVPEDIKHGTILAYLTDKSDSKVERPIARVSIKPYIGALKGKVLLYTAETCYNVLYGEFVYDLLRKFQDNVADFIIENYNKKIKNRLTDVYYPNENLYKDEKDSGELNLGDIDTQAKMEKKLKSYRGDLAWEALNGYWVFSTESRRDGLIHVSGKIIIEPIYTAIEQANSDDLRLLKVQYGWRWGLYNIPKREFIINPMYSNIENMTDFYHHEGNQYVKAELNGQTLADVEFRDGTTNYIDKNGNLFYPVSK